MDLLDYMLNINIIINKFMMAFIGESYRSFSVTFLGVTLAATNGFDRGAPLDRESNHSYILLNLRSY